MKCLARRGVAAVAVLVLVATAGWTTVSEADDGCSKKCEPNVLACRLANYKQFQKAAWSHLSSAGFKYVFMNVPRPQQIEAAQEQLDKHGLKVAVLRGDTDLGRASSVDELAEQLQTCEKMGVKYMFLSPKHRGVSKEVACERLRKVGDVAKKHGVTIGLETHPDLGTNADVHLETMKKIDHPNIRVNFDCANITYYNKDTDAVTELKKIIDYVGTVEIKDHNGQYKTWNFPVLGQGVVDIPAVLGVLKEHGYTGPITMEVEGIKGVTWDEATAKKAVADSAKYLRSLGKFR